MLTILVAATRCITAGLVQFTIPHIEINFCVSLLYSSYALIHQAPLDGDETLSLLKFDRSDLEPQLHFATEPFFGVP